jgi:hypothetical protein
MMPLEAIAAAFAAGFTLGMGLTQFLLDAPRRAARHRHPSSLPAEDRPDWGRP